MASVTGHRPDIDLLWAIEGLLADGEIESGTPAYAVAQQAAHQGLESLTAREQAIYDRVVLPALTRWTAAADFTGES